MSEVQVLKPQKTWSHLAARRRKPSEYEIVSANLHYNDRDANAPYELAPGMFMNEWYKKNTFGTALKHADWNAFRDPDEVVYRTYNMMQDGQETYVFGLFDQFNQREHDKALDPRWAGSLARLYTPARYLFHTIQVASAYLPLSDNAMIPKSLGTRHRAAVGISEVTDAITVVVSEETGGVTITRNGQFMVDLSQQEYLKYLRAELVTEEKKKQPWPIRLARGSWNWGDK